MKTISIPTNDRLDTLERVIESLSRAQGFKEWTVVFSVEPNTAVRQYISRLSIPYMASFNSSQRGCWVNTFLAADFAYSVGSTFNLYLEDDVILSPDALTLCSSFQKRDAVLLLRRPHDMQTNEPEKVSICNSGLFGDGFAFHRDLWPRLRACWFDDSVTMWDWSVQFNTIKRNIQHWRPHLNRSQNIGVNGTHTKHGTDPNRYSACYTGHPVASFDYV